VPDVVLKRRHDGAILVIERKTTMAKDDAVPAIAWPRVQAQLWCYAWIDDWLDAPEVYVLAQFWSRRSRGPGHFQLSWAKPRWRRSDLEFHRTWSEAFGIYGGRVVGPARDMLQKTAQKQSPEGIPTRNDTEGVKLGEGPNEYTAVVPYSQRARAQNIPGRRWDRSRKLWVFPKTQKTYDALIAEFGDNPTS